MPENTFATARPERPADNPCPRIVTGSDDDPPPPSGPAAAAAAPEPEDEGPTSAWPIIVVYRHGGTIFVLPPRKALELARAKRALVLVLVDRNGRIRSAQCTCPFYKRERTCIHMWEASFELASQDRAVS